MAQIFLIAPPDADAGHFPALLGSVLAAAEISALLVRRGSRAENAYKALIKTLVPVTQAHGCALLIEGEPGEVRMLNADGIQLAPEAKAVRAAVASLKPQLIVGAGPVSSRHEAMTIGELDVDYLIFGSLEGGATPEQRELARWWAETMEIPAIQIDVDASLDTVDANGCEFIGLGANIWNAQEGPASAIAAFAQRLEAQNA